MCRRVVSLAFCLCVLLLLPGTALAADYPPSCQPVGEYAGAVGLAKYLLCIPPNYNGNLVVFAHGYVAPSPAIAIPDDQLILPDGSTIPEIVNGLGFGFVATSYSKNGLAVLEGMKDILLLLDAVKPLVPDTEHVFLVGASEGSLVVTKLIEVDDGRFDGALALCGPCGDFRAQINHVGDFRVVFDYFFPGVLPYPPIPDPSLSDAVFNGYFVSRVAPAIQARPLATAQVLSVNRVFTGFSAANTAEAFYTVLRYNAVAPEDIKNELGGQPSFDNSTRSYSGSFFDRALNRGINRFTADQAALAEMEKYQTTGNLQAPLVNMHTTWDPLVPYSQAQQYGKKVLLRGKYRLYTHIPVVRFGHCQFTTNELLFGFYLMVAKAAGQ
jgi:hypothetical protein